MGYGQFDGETVTIESASHERWSTITDGSGFFGFVATIVIESAMFAIGILIYWDFTKPVDRIGSVVFWAFVIVLAGIYISTASAAPPPNLRVLEYMALSGWLLPVWAAWFDRHREANV